MGFVLEKELPPLWREDHNLSALGDLQVVEPRAAVKMAEKNLRSGSARGYGRVWELLNVETWARAHG